MAIETFGVTPAVLEPYLTQIEGQFGAASDGLSDTDITQIVKNRAAEVGIALRAGLGTDWLTLVAADEYAYARCQSIVIDLVLPDIYRSLYQGSVLPEYLGNAWDQARKLLKEIRESPGTIGVTARGRDVRYTPMTDADAENDTLYPLFRGTGLERRNRW